MSSKLKLDGLKESHSFSKFISELSEEFRDDSEMQFLKISSDKVLNIVDQESTNIKDSTEIDVVFNKKGRSSSREDLKGKKNKGKSSPKNSRNPSPRKSNKIRSSHKVLKPVEPVAKEEKQKSESKVFELKQFFESLAKSSISKDFTLKTKENIQSDHKNNVTNSVPKLKVPAGTVPETSTPEFEEEKRKEKKKKKKNDEDLKHDNESKKSIKTRRHNKKKKHKSENRVTNKDSEMTSEETSTPKSSYLSHSWEINPSEITYFEKIGEGTSCIVYKGTYRGQVVALKTLKDTSKKQVDNFIKEFDILSQFRSPYVTYFFGGCTEPKPTMVLGYSSRGSLYDTLRNSSINIDWSIVIKVSLSIIKGLSSMHSWKPQIVHRDLKSRNILVEEDWQTKLCDFGESRFATTQNIDTLCKLRGTYAYIAPEIYFGQSYTTRSDVYAFGIVLWELCTRCILKQYQSPYSSYKSLIHDFQIIVQAAKKGIRPEINKDIPEPMVNVMKLCWDHEPKNRPDVDTLLHFFEDISEFPDQPDKWGSVPNAIKWPPPDGPGVPGNPPMPRED